MKISGYDSLRHYSKNLKNYEIEETNQDFYDICKFWFLKNCKNLKILQY